MRSFFDKTRADELFGVVEVVGLATVGIVTEVEEPPEAIALDAGTAVDALDAGTAVDALDAGTAVDALDAGTAGDALEAGTEAEVEVEVEAKVEVEEEDEAEAEGFKVPLGSTLTEPNSIADASSFWTTLFFRGSVFWVGLAQRHFQIK